MVENMLARDLRSYLADRLNGFSLPSQAGRGEPETRRTPQIVNGYLPPKRSTATDDFPFIVVRPESGRTSPESTSVDVSIIVGCYSETYDGHEDCINVMAKIRQALIDLPCGTLSQRYQFDGDLSWSLADEQPWPYWELTISTSWTLNAPQAQCDDFITTGGKWHDEEETVGTGAD